MFFSDIHLNQSALTCIAASMSVEPNNDDVMKLFQQEAMPNKSLHVEMVGAEVKDSTSWLVIFCLQQLIKASQGKF